MAEKIPGSLQSFSSYPGPLMSGDDFYILSSGLVGVMLLNVWCINSVVVPSQLVWSVQRTVTACCFCSSVQNLNDGFHYCKKLT